MKIRFVLSLFAAGLFVSPVRAETLETAEKRLAGAAKSVTSMKAKRHTVTNIDASGTKSVSEDNGTFEMTNKDGKPLWRVESKNTMTLNTGGSTMKTETTGLMVCDGQFVWSLSDAMGQKLVTKMKVPPDNSSLAGESFFSSLKKDHKLRMLPDATIEGKSAFVIEATPMSADNAKAKTTYYILKDSAITAKTESCDTSGKPLNTMTLSDIKINSAIPAERFTFKPPAGVQVMDMTKQ